MSPLKLKQLLLILILALVTSCGDKKEEVPVNEVAPPRKLKTDFLSMGNLGDVKGASNISIASNTITLADDQAINILDQSTGEIEIENFDHSDLEVEQIIIGNSTDQNLLKVKELKEENGNTKVFVSNATISELIDGKDAQIAFTATPELNYSAQDNAKLQVVSKPAQSNQQPALNQISFASSSPSEKAKAASLSGEFNLIKFKDYEVLNINGQALLLGNGIKDGDQKNFNVNANGNVTIKIDEGEVQFIPTFRGDFKFKRGRVKNLLTSIDALVKYRFKITVESTGGVAGEFTFPLFKQLKFPVRIPGPPPVYVDVVVDFPMGVKLNYTKKGKSTFIVQSEYAFTAESHYTPDTGNVFDSYSDYIVRDRNIKQQGNSDLTFEVFFEPKVQTMLYKVLGPYVYMHTALQAHLQYPLMPSKDDLSFNFHGGIGAQVVVPVWDKEVFDTKSPVLFNVSRSWDIIGPKKGGKTSKGSTKGEVKIQVNKLAKDGSVPLKLLPGDAPELTTVGIYTNPQFGKLVLDENFNMNHMAYYYPPRNVEGQDSFKIQFTNMGKKSEPTRIVLTLGEEAQKQAKDLDYSKFRTAETNHTDVTYTIPSGTYVAPVTTKIQKRCRGKNCKKEKDEKECQGQWCVKPEPPTLKSHYVAYPSVWFNSYPTKKDIGSKFGNCTLSSSEYKGDLTRRDVKTKDFFHPELIDNFERNKIYGRPLRVMPSLALISYKKVTVVTLFDEYSFYDEEFVEGYELREIPPEALLHYHFDDINPNPLMPRQAYLENNLKNFFHHRMEFDCPMKNVKPNGMPPRIERIFGDEMIFSKFEDFEKIRQERN